MFGLWGGRQLTILVAIGMSSSGKHFYYVLKLAKLSYVKPNLGHLDEHIGENACQEESLFYSLIIESTLFSSAQGLSTLSIATQHVMLLSPFASTDKCVSSSYFLAGAYQWLLAVNTTFCLWPQALHLVSLFLTLFPFTNRTATHNNPLHLCNLHLYNYDNLFYN